MMEETIQVEELLTKEEFEKKYGVVEVTTAPENHTLEEASENGIETRKDDDNETTD